MDAFRELGLDWEADEAAARRAYAKLIKQYRPDSHPVEFARIREAYETVLHYCRMRHEDDAGQEEEPLERQPAAEQVRREAALDEPVPLEPVPFEPGPRVRVVVDVPASHDDSALVSEMIGELDGHAPAESEARMLQIYSDQAQAISACSLDVQMDYQEKLREWLLLSGHTPLMLINEVAARYGWREQTLEIGRQYGFDAAKRLEMLIALSGMYAKIMPRPGPYLQVDGVLNQQPPLIASHFGAEQAQMQLRRWRAACDQIGMPELAGRLGYASLRKVQVFWVDVFIAFFAGGVGWLVMWPMQGWWEWMLPVLVAAAGLYAAPLGRFLWGLARSVSPLQLGLQLGRRYREWRARNLEKKGSIAVVTREITLLVLLGPVFLFGVLVLTKDNFGIVLLVGGFLAILSLVVLLVLYKILAETEKILAELGVRIIGLLHRIGIWRGEPLQYSSPEPLLGQQDRQKVSWWPTFSGGGGWWIVVFAILQLLRVLSGH